MSPGSAPSTSEPRTLVSHPELRSHRSLPTFKSEGEAPRTLLERILSVFADVRAGEGLGVLLLTLNVFLLLAAYYLLKPAREALILTEGNAVTKVQSSAAQAVLLIGLVPAFGWLASRVNRVRLITITSVFFAVNLVIFYLLGQAGVREGIAFFIWVGIFNVFVISQFWAFANDLYTEGQGRRLFPMIGVGASAGAWIGSTSVPTLISSLGFTPYTLMVCGAVLLLLSLGLTAATNGLQHGQVDPLHKKIEEAPLGKEGGFELIFKDRYLIWIAVLTVLLNVVNTIGEFLLSDLVRSAASGLASDAERRQYVASFYGSFFGMVNLVGFVLQLLVTSRVMRTLGVRGGLFILPLIAFVNYAVIAVVPILAVVRIGKMFENSTDYSIQNTVRQALYLPTSRETKYKAKAAIDTFFMRLGDVVAAGVATAGTAIGLGLGGFAWVNVILTAGWLFVAGQISREHRRKTV